VPQLPHSPFDPHATPPDPAGGGTNAARGLIPLRLPRHMAPPPPGLPATRQERDAALELLLRTAARQSRVVAPPDLSSSIHDSLSRLRMEAMRAHAQPEPVPVRPRLADVPMLLAEAWAHTRTLVHYQDLSPRQRKVALGGASTLGLALLCLLGVALDPGEVVALLGIVSAVMLGLLAVGHLLSATVLAVLSSGMLAVLAIALYAALAALWVRLVRRPVEA
jgi:hypothetical protein